MPCALVEGAGDHRSAGYQIIELVQLDVRAASHVHASAAASAAQFMARQQQQAGIAVPAMQCSSGALLKKKFGPWPILVHRMGLFLKIAPKTHFLDKTS
jgi:hypothetical protein